MRLYKLHDDDKKIKKLKSERLSKDWEDIKEVFHYHGLLYVLEVICLKLISRYYNDLFVSHFSIEKT